jgi:hypothetical protein
LRDFTAWIEQNILFSLDHVPFDKNDAILVPEAGGRVKTRFPERRLESSSTGVDRQLYLGRDK